MKKSRPSKVMSVVRDGRSRADRQAGSENRDTEPPSFEPIVDLWFDGEVRRQWDETVSMFWQWV